MTIIIHLWMKNRKQLVNSYISAKHLQIIRDNFFIHDLCVRNITRYDEFGKNIIHLLPWQV